MLLGFLRAGFRSWKVVLCAPLFWLSLVICLYTVAAAFINSRDILPDDSFANIVRKCGDLIAISGIFSFMIAWALQLDSANVGRALFLWLLGYFMAVLLGAEWNDLANYLAGRPLFGLQSGFGFYTLCALLGVIILALGDRGKLGYIGRAQSVGILLLLVLLLCLFLVGRMRGAWLAAAVVGPVVGYALFQRRPNTRYTRQGKLFGWSVLALFLLIIFWNYDVIAKRFLEEWDVLVSYWHNGSEDLRLSSTSYRIWLWEEAIERIAVHPIFGWGPGTSSHLIAQSEVLKHLGHYHNVYLQLIVEVGLAGFSLFAAWLYLVGRGTLRAYASGTMSADMFLLITSLVAVFALVSMIQYRHSEAGQFFIMLMGALAINYQITFPPRSREVTGRFATTNEEQSGH
ncbi:MAG: O-antigen ligase family protein [Halioglobus sp.]|nr:O-antigen ligase family protein [Halioglobus sp.]